MPNCIIRPYDIHAADGGVAWTSPAALGDAVLPALFRSGHSHAKHRSVAALY